MSTRGHSGEYSAYKGSLDPLYSKDIDEVTTGITHPTQEYMPLYYHALGPSDAPIYRLIRLRALSQSPSQFSSTFSREVAFPLETWQTRLNNPHGVTLLATSRATLGEEDSLSSDDWVQSAQFEASDRLHCGMICCIKSFEDPTDAFIVGTWVAPLTRRNGIGQKLMHMALEWASTHQRENVKFKAVLLDVRIDNMEARHLYERCGFTSIGGSPDHPGELRYVHRL